MRGAMIGGARCSSKRSLLPRVERFPTKRPAHRRIRGRNEYLDQCRAGYFRHDKTSMPFGSIAFITIYPLVRRRIPSFTLSRPFVFFATPPHVARAGQKPFFASPSRRQVRRDPCGCPAPRAPGGPIEAARLPRTGTTEPQPLTRIAPRPRRHAVREIMYRPAVERRGEPVAGAACRHVELDAQPSCSPKGFPP